MKIKVVIDNVIYNVRKYTYVYIWKLYHLQFLRPSHQVHHKTITRMSVNTFTENFGILGMLAYKSV